MNRNTQQRVNELNKKHSRKSWWVRAVSVLAAFTVFCTTYALILPAITIEKDQLAEAEYELEDLRLTTGGAIEMPAAAETEISEITADAEDGASVIISGVLPEDAEAAISPVVFDDEQLIAYFGEELAASMKGFVAYDISIWSGGEEWQPDESVSVQVLQPAIELEEEDTLTAVHFEETEEETTLIEVAASVTEDGSIEFPAEGFSIYAFYTVDFHNGNATYSIEGDSSVLLSEVFANLGLDLDAAQVVSAVFSDELLIAVEPIMDEDENIIDWILTSLAPFDTEETLTLVFADGSEKLIDVTDAKSGFLKTNSKVSVSVKWDIEPSAGTIVASLYKDYTDTGKTLVLSRDNNWSGTFTDLGSSEAVYTVEYTTIEGYAYSADTSISDRTEEVSWTKVNSLTNGGTYVFIGGSGSKRAVAESKGSLIGAGVSIANGKINELSDAMQWYYDGTGLKNKETSKYLRIDSDQAYTRDSQTSVSYSNSKLSRHAGGNNNYYLRWDKDNKNYTGTSSSDSAATLTAYVKTVTTSGTLGFVINATKKTVNPDSEASAFEHNKTIDYLGDGETNNDTDRSGKDDYRLYLDMTGKQEPIDLIIVVDGSGSMGKTDMTINNSGGQRRDDAITYFLNGTKSSSNYAQNKKNGFLDYFLGLNSKNNVAVVRFYGENSGDINKSSFVSNFETNLDTDCNVLLDWTHSNSFVNCERKANNGTNYEAGLKKATDLFGADGISGNGHKKMMIFLSDGVPTAFMIDANDLGKTTYNGYTLDSNDLGRRWGNCSYQDAENYSRCKEPSMRAFDDFMEANPGVTVFTIGVSADINATSEGNSQSPDVLKYMAWRGGGAFMSVTSNIDDLKSNLESVFFPQQVTISDTLSRYVTYLSEDPDILVTRTSKADGTVTVLYDGNLTTPSVTLPGTDKDAPGQTLVTSVTYTPLDPAAVATGSTGIVKAVFNEKYRFKPEYTYTLSFNVKANQTAYDEYASSGYNASGNKGTDFGSNATSSDKSGFFSNDSATVSYNVSGTMISDTYKKPVVQVDAWRVVLRKIVNDDDTGGTFSFSAVYDGYDVIGDELVAKEYTSTSPKSAYLRDYDDSGEEAVFLVKKSAVGTSFSVSESFGADDTRNYAVDYRWGDTGEFTSLSSPYDVSKTITGDCVLWYRNTPVKTAKLTVSKTVANGGSGTFTFEYKEGTGDDWAGSEIFTITVGSDTAEPVWEKVFPAGTVVSVREVGHDGYYASYTLDGGDAVYCDYVNAIDMSADRILAFTNTSGYELPSTGGIGTTILYVVGGILLVGAAVLLVTRRRMDRE